MQAAEAFTDDPASQEHLQQHLPQLQTEIARRVLAELPASEGSQSGSADLLKTVSAIHAATSQREILRTLLDGSVHYCGRAALFIVKSGQVAGWQGRAFSDELKDFAVDAHSSLVARVLEGRTPISATASEMDHKFIKQFRRTASAFCFPWS